MIYIYIYIYIFNWYSVLLIVYLNMMTLFNAVTILHNTYAKPRSFACAAARASKSIYRSAAAVEGALSLILISSIDGSMGQRNNKQQLNNAEIEELLTYTYC